MKIFFDAMFGGSSGVDLVIASAFFSKILEDDRDL